MAKRNESILAEVPEEPTAAKVSREMASQINPLIASTWTEDTLQNVSNVVNELGYLISRTEMETENIYLVFSTAAAALDWECENIYSAVQVRSDRQVQGGAK